MERIIIFGAGDRCKEFAATGLMSIYDVVAIVDNDKGKWGDRIGNVEIQSPDKGLEKDFNKILILSYAEREIREQLKKDFGINEENFITVNELILELCKNLLEEGCLFQMHNLFYSKMFKEEKVVLKEAIEDTRLVNRIITSYNREIYKDNTDIDSWWTNGWVWKEKEDIHRLLRSKKFTEIREMLRNPAENNLFVGFDSLTKNENYLTPNSLVSDGFIRLLSLVGVIRMPNSEAKQKPVAVDVDNVLDRLSEKMEMEVVFPNPYPGEVGIKTSRGIISYRTLQALYQTYRIKEILGKNAKDARVLEIGAGLGRTAYYVHQMGIKNYTIIDLPMTNVAQAYFLGRTLGEETISLAGETNEKEVRILSADMLNKLQDEKFDLILNVDSYTEMDEESQKNYWEFIQGHTKVFLSVNHEINPHTVNEYYTNTNYRVRRSAYPMRRGYIEEEVWFE